MFTKWYEAGRSLSLYSCTVCVYTFPHITSPKLMVLADKLWRILCVNKTTRRLCIQAKSYQMAHFTLNKAFLQTLFRPSCLWSSLKENTLSRIVPRADGPRGQAHLHGLAVGRARDDKRRAWCIYIYYGTYGVYILCIYIYIYIYICICAHDDKQRAWAAGERYGGRHAQWKDSSATAAGSEHKIYRNRG